MGKKAITAQLRAECHEVAHEVARDLMALRLAQGVGVLSLHEVTEVCVGEGIEIGLRIACGDIVAGRRLLARLEELGAKTGEAAGRAPNAERMLTVLSK